MGAHTASARVRPLWILVLSVVAASCTSVPAPHLVEGVEYIEGQQLDIHHPSAGGPWPVVVVLHGVGVDRLDYTAFSAELSRAGAVVFNADWTVLASSLDAATAGAGCAARYALANAEEYGGDPERLIVVGHSAGAIYAGRIATGDDDPIGSCPFEGEVEPIALVLVAPAQLPGGPGPWPRSSLQADSELRVAVIHGLADDVIPLRQSRRTVEILEDAGYDVTLHLIPGGTHYNLLLADTTGLDVATTDPEAQPGLETTIEIILELIESPSG